MIVSAVNPNCEGITCENDGKCLDLNATHAHCDCAPGFSGDRCGELLSHAEIEPKLHFIIKIIEIKINFALYNYSIGLSVFH